MPNWSESMQQTFEYYEVDPVTQKDKRLLNNVKSSTITWDSEVETLGSAVIDVSESVGECYVRVYMVIIQNGIKDKIPLGTFLVQTPTSSFNGKIRNISMDAYTPLIELKEKLPPIGYFIQKDENIMEWAGRLTAENLRATVITASSDRKLYDDFLAEQGDTWLSYLSSLIASIKHSYNIDELGRISFAPEQDIESLQPVWTYTDDNASILHPEINMNHDLYMIPNVVEVVYSNNEGSWHVVVKNEDPNSPTSIQRRGRQIIHRVMDPDLHDINPDAPEDTDPTTDQLRTYASDLLKKLSTVEYTILYTHGYCPARVGDCVRFNCERAGLVGVKAKIVSQTIKCVPGCPVSEKAVFTTKLWG